jgi:hypothetical protein
VYSQYIARAWKTLNAIFWIKMKNLRMKQKCFLFSSHTLIFVRSWTLTLHTVKDKNKNLVYYSSICIVKHFLGPSVLWPQRGRDMLDVWLVSLCYVIPLHRTAAAPLLGENLNRSSAVITKRSYLLLMYTKLEHYLYTSSRFLSTRQRLKPAHVPALQTEPQ